MKSSAKISEPTVDLLAEGPPAWLELNGFGSIESQGKSTWRWGFGPRAELKGEVSPARGWKLISRLRLPVPGAALSLRWNGKLLRSVVSRVKDEIVEWDLPLELGSGHWALEFHSENWAHFLQDARPLAFVVEKFRLVPAFPTEGRICPYPFSRMEIPGEPFVPCCQSWLTEDYFKLQAGTDPWNGPAAKALRQSILEGTYQYCHLDRCGTTLVPREELAEFAKNPGELPISPGNLLALSRGDTQMPEGPSAATLMGDPRCNLACASCRPEKITKLDSQQAARKNEMERLLYLYGNNLRSLKAAGDGEVFFSDSLRSIVKDSWSLPKLENLELLTNGILMNEQAFRELEPGSRKVRRISVSLDAGDAETYRKVRGGDFKKLIENLEWVAEERKKLRFDFLGLTYVVREENLVSMGSFFALAERLGVDEVYTSQLLPWVRMPLNFEAQAVHLPSHPKHQEFAGVLSDLKAKSWSFQWRTTLP